LLCWNKVLTQSFFEVCIKTRESLKKLDFPGKFQQLFTAE